MSCTVYACVHAAEFPTQALLRLRPDLQSHPVVVLEGCPPQDVVCSMNLHARRRGISLGMTRSEIEELGGIQIFSRSSEVESAAATVFLEFAAKFSPRIEMAGRDKACACVLDITGTERLFGPAKVLTRRIHSALLRVGFHTSIAVSENYQAALLKASAARGIVLIAAGEEAQALADLQINSLDLSDEHLETFAMWGIGTLGELASLPVVELVTRFGTLALTWHEQSRGISPHVFQPAEPAILLQETYEFENPVEQMEPLLFISARMIEYLTQRAADRMLSLASLSINMRLEGGGVHRLAIRPALPTIDRKFLLKLLQLEIGANPPQAAVISFSMIAEPGLSRRMQLGLFAPQTPEPSRLDVTLARLRAMVGDDRVGSPLLEDTNRAGSFRMERFQVNRHPSASLTENTHMALRRLRPPLPVHVRFHAMKPSAFSAKENRFHVTESFGPWRSSGCWWSTPQWDTEEWDVLAADEDGASLACLLLHDLRQNEWRLEAYYD